MSHVMSIILYKINVMGIDLHLNISHYYREEIIILLQKEVFERTA